MTNKLEVALKWIVAILRKHNVPFQISGGFAANIYGSNRAVADIDIDLPNEKIFEIQSEVDKYIIYGPKKYKDKEFDLLLMTLKYKGQVIDLGGIDSLKIFNKETKKWITERIDLSKAKKKKVCNLIIPIEPIKNLVSEKKKISRAVDIQDVEALSR